ncbi:MAG: sigma-70 domain-containing protein [Lachnospira sp.]
MSDNKEKQALFMEALNELKEYAKVNGNIVTRDDVTGYFKGIDLDESSLNMVYGYLLANNIKVSGEDLGDNPFLAMMEEEKDEKDSDENESFTMLSEEDYKKDEEYLAMYLDELSKIEQLSDTGRAFLLMNIVEDKDKESLKILSSSFLSKIVEWIEPFRRKGVLSGDLIQEGNLAMMAYISEERFLNNYEWKDKIKEGSTEDLLYVLNEIEKEVKGEVEGALSMLIDEQSESDRTTEKVLSKVNLVNDWALRLKNEMGRKPTVQEVADKMGVSKQIVLDAMQLSANNIEDIDVGDNKKNQENV